MSQPTGSAFGPPDDRLREATGSHNQRPLGHPRACGFGSRLALAAGTRRSFGRDDIKCNMLAAVGTLLMPGISSEADG
jgi:hypothetical protein